jgi:hypothetical protein
MTPENPVLHPEKSLSSHREIFNHGRPPDSTTSKTYCLALRLNVASPPYPRSATECGRVSLTLQYVMLAPERVRCHGLLMVLPAATKWKP